MQFERTDSVYSIYSPVLPFAVETSIELEPFCWLDSSTTLLYVDLELAADRYSDNAHKKIFLDLSGLMSFMCFWF